jgi:hypothetical protein
MSGEDKPIRFGGISAQPRHGFLEWVKVAEETGFAIAGIADSQSLYRDVYVVEALVAAHTRTIRFWLARDQSDDQAPGRGRKRRRQ